VSNGDCSAPENPTLLFLHGVNEGDGERRQHERLDEFSDRDAPLVKELGRKLITVERALKYLKAQGLAPGSALIDEG
jgi:hypothetical protein